MADMLTHIEQESLSLIAARIDGIRAAGIQKDGRGLFVNPSVAVACLDGEFKRVSKSTWKQACTVSVLLTFKDLQGEEKRRLGINPLIQAVIQILLDQDFGLKIEPLSPQRFRDITTTADYTEGKIRYLLQFETAFSITKQSTEEVEDLLGLAMGFILKPGDETADAENDVPLA